MIKKQNIHDSGHGSRVTIGKNRMLRVNGKPFFPIAARHIPNGATPSLLKQAGFNAVRWTAFGTDTDVVPPAELPDDLGGLMFYPYLYKYADFSTDADKRREALTSLIQRVKDHPALLCYEQANEPAYTWRDFARPQFSAEGMTRGSELIRQLDPNHPIRVGHSNFNLVSTLKKYNPAVDIVGSNPYMITPKIIRQHAGTRPDGRFVDSPNQTISAVGDITTKMMRVAEGRPVWMQLQACAMEDFYNEAHTPENRGTGPYEHHRLYPTKLQMRFMAFNSIVRGATAISWAMIGLSAGSDAWENVRAVVGELRALQDVLCAPELQAKPEIQYRELGFGDWTGVETLVKLHEDRVWIIAVNTPFDPMEATFSNLPKGIGGTLDVFGESRKVSVKAGSFSDRFQPYEVHIYSAG